MPKKLPNDIKDQMLTRMRSAPSGLEIETFSELLGDQVLHSPFANSEWFLLPAEPYISPRMFSQFAHI
jgi:hypothetical protein